MAQRILRPLDYGGMLDELFDLYKNNVLVLTGIAGLLQVPIAVATAILMIPFYSAMTRLQTNPNTDPTAVFASMLPMFALFIPLMVLSMVAYVLSTGAITWAVSTRYLGGTPTILGSIKAILPKALPLAGTIFLVGLLTTAGLVVCCVGAIPVFIFTSLATEVIILEGKGPIDAIKRSFELTKPHWARVLVIGILSIVLMYAVSFALAMPVQIIAMMGKNIAVAQTANQLVSGIVNALVMPFYVTVYVLLYYDIRVRSEGFDIEMLAQGMGAQGNG